MKHLIKLLACMALLAAPMVAGAQPRKQDAQNNKENSLIDEGEQSQQLSRAMHFYNLGEYSQALVCFSRAGSSSSWTSAQKDAYNRCREEAAYATWKAENGNLTATGETAALELVRDFPNSSHAGEMKDYLFNYYMSQNNLDAASQYVTTTTQKKRFDAARDAQNKGKKKQNDNRQQSTSPSLFHPTLGIGAELCVIDIEPLEAAMPLELRLFRANSRLNLHIGARIGVRGTILGDSVNVNRGGVPMQLKGTFCYYQASPFIKLRLNLGSSPSRGGLFISAIGRVNYNFGYSYFQELSDLDYYGNPVGGDTRAQHVDILTPFTYTGAAELGYGGKRFEVFLYYSYDLTRPISQQTVTAMGRSAADPHHELMAGSNFGGHFEKVGFIGGGLRFYFSD